MVNFAPHSKVVFGGALIDAATNSPGEIWSCSIAIVAPGGVAFDEAVYMESIAAPLSDWFHTGVNNMSNMATLLYLKVNAVNAQGHYSEQQVNTHNYVGGDFQAGPSAPSGSPIASLAYTWGTAKRTPPGAFGRIYPPNATYGVPGAFTVSSADRDKAVNAARRLLNIIGNIGADAVQPVIASGVNATNTPITKVRVGNVFDTQRRRKNAFRESYSVLPYPA